ncbi:PREDICTED: MATH domain and coiled-coil domain-containing protein At3g58210-like [Theobroma cacao]|uniref:MATH domain and coiled-coil domain-containing protein At3g58210-like n=1 Tax=Theobroma cacao TaxID=3641 RepID=A0AB32W1Y2_THECC|nr:PREDICTED: MATH domain and coiled-coil domain-containing protein At3g58210-like [Theobroma cacao]
MSRDRSGKREEIDYYRPPAPFANNPAPFANNPGLNLSLLLRLLLYPKGNKKSNGGDCISLYLQIAETEKLPPAWEANVNFRLFVFDQIRDKYLTVEDAGAVKRFHQMKTEWGFDQLVPLESFNDPSNGYLVDDSCVFGAEVFVIEQTRKLECVSIINQPHGNPITFKIKNFSKLDKEY